MSDEIAFGNWTPEMSRRGLIVPEISEVGPPPSEDLLDFGFILSSAGKPSKVWFYRNEAGSVLMAVARYERPEGKLLIPWAWHLKENRWVCKSLAKPRPLYGLELLADFPKLPVMLVEGEKACDAARAIVGQRYIVMTWLNGANGVKAADWSPLGGRKVLIWPDADQAGLKAADEIAEYLKEKCSEIKYIRVPMDGSLDKGWDAADALADGWDWPRLAAWAKPLIFVSWPIQAPNPAPVELPPLPRTIETPRIEVIQPDQPEEEATDEQFVASHFATWERLQLSCLKNGQPHINLDNVYRFLSNEPLFKNYLWYDEFHEQIFTQYDPTTHRQLPKPKLWGDGDELVLLNYLQRHVGMTRMSLITVSQGVSLFAQQHIRNEPKEWLMGLSWDGTPRMDKLLILGFGAMPDVYAKMLATNWLTSMVARIMRPGCQVDSMPVLCGAQGIKKSTSLAALGGFWFAELSQKIDSLEFFRALRGKLMVEISELAGFKKTQIEEIKKMITTKQDHYRGMWGRHTEAHPRRTVFVGTTNSSNFLSDETGARRFWPIQCSKADPDWIRANREQLFAEAASRFYRWSKTRDENDGWWIMPEKETRENQDRVRDFDEWENSIEEWLEDTNIDEASKKEREQVTLTDIAKGALGLDRQKIGRMEQLRISKCLRILGWESHNTTREQKRVTLWRRRS